MNIILSLMDSTPMVYIYIKRDEENWSLWRYSPGFVTIKKEHPPRELYDYEGRYLFPKTLEYIRNIFSELKPMLGDLREAIIRYLVKDKLDFNVDI
jgi:hypothetical protein